MRGVRLKPGFLALCLAALLAACGTKLDPGFDPGACDGVAAATWCADIAPIVEAACLGCHSATAVSRGGAPLGVDFDTLAEVKDRLAGVVASVSGGSMPPSGGLPEAQRLALGCWAEAGAPDGSCADGDTGPDGDRETVDGDSPEGSDLTYYCTGLKPVLDTRCTGCHAASRTGADRANAPVGVDYDTYAAARANAARGNIRVKAGTMPPGSPLPAAEKALFQTWLDDGTPDCPGADGDRPIDGDIDPDPEVPACTSDRWYNLAREPGADMNPGMDCIACHLREGEGPPFDAAGTVMGGWTDQDLCIGVQGVTVEILDATGRVALSSLTNGSGNFGFEEVILPRPYTVRLRYQGRERSMAGGQTNGACNACHTMLGANGAPGRVVAP